MRSNRLSVFDKLVAALAVALTPAIITLADKAIGADNSQTPGVAASAAREASRDTDTRPDTPAPDFNGLLASMQSASQLKGLPVHDPQDHNLGKVADLLIDIPSARVFDVLVTAGSENDVAVPSGGGIAKADQTAVVVKWDKAKLAGGPRLSAGVNDSAALGKAVIDSCAHAMQKADYSQKVPSTVARGSKVVGWQVSNQAHEDLGNLVDLMVDLTKGQIVFAVVSLDGSEGTRYAVPPEALTVNPDKPGLQLNAERKNVAEFARHGEMLSKQLHDPEMAAAIYRVYGQEPGAALGAAADPTRENVRAKVESTPAVVSVVAVAPEAAPANKAAGLPDSEITKQILTAMIREDFGNTYATKLFKIITVNGHVTLQGKVKNQKQKDVFGKAAESVVGPGNVDNQLEIKK